MPITDNAPQSSVGETILAIIARGIIAIIAWVIISVIVIVAIYAHVNSSILSAIWAVCSLLLLFFAIFPLVSYAESNENRIREDRIQHEAITAQTRQKTADDNNHIPSEIADGEMYLQCAIPAESRPILEPADVRKFLAAASSHSIRLAHTDKAAINHFFNAIRYGQIDHVRKSVSDIPLLMLARDASGNTPLEVALQEQNTKLLNFFKSCMPKS